MKLNIGLIVGLFLTVFVGVALAQAEIQFEFPEWFVILMNATIVPVVVQYLKKWIPAGEMRVIVAGAISFVTAVVAAFAWGNQGLADIPALLVWAYVASQIAYNLFWHRLLQTK